MGADGFEPPKAEPADLQSAPFGHSGTHPSFSRLPLDFLENLRSGQLSHKAKTVVNRAVSE